MAQYIDIHTHGPGRFDDQFIVVGDSSTAPPYCLGQHPWRTSEDFEFSEIDLLGALAVGEVGLDYSPKVVEKSPKEKQLQLFRQQVKLAIELGKPLVIHSVHAQGNTLEILRGVEVAWLWHGFGGKAENGRQILAVSAKGFLSFGAQLIHDTALQQVFMDIPLGRIFLETDTAKDYDIVEIYRIAAQLKNVTIEQLKDQILQNFNLWLGQKEQTCCLEQKI